jgi:trans-aconitate 2-methyltransferase
MVRLMAARWPAARVLGVDASDAMLAKARSETGTATHGEAAADRPGPPGRPADRPARITWMQADLARWQPDAVAPPDLVYSNAALHWLPGHAALFPRLVQGLSAAGVLAVQMPRNFDAPSHTAIADTVRAGPWRERLAPMLRPSPVAAPAWYFDLLAPHASSVDLWETEYLQVLTGPDPVKEWTKGTWLAPFLAALADEDERARFEADYAARVRAAYPPRADGTTLFPFRRLFLIVQR